MCFGNLFATSDADPILSQVDAYDLFLNSLDEDIGDQVAMMPQVQAIAGIIYICNSWGLLSQKSMICSRPIASWSCSSGTHNESRM